MREAMTRLSLEWLSTNRGMRTRHGAAHAASPPATSRPVVAALDQHVGQQLQVGRRSGVLEKGTTW